MAGNELCGTGVSARLEAEQYAKDLTKLKKLVAALYPGATTQPKVLGPAGFFDDKWFSTFLEATGPEVVNGLTHHIYNLGAGNKLIILSLIKLSFQILLNEAYVLKIN